MANVVVSDWEERRDKAEDWFFLYRTMSKPTKVMYCAAAGEEKYLQANVPEQQGYYLWYDMYSYEGSIVFVALYVGRATNLRVRIQQHWRIGKWKDCRLEPHFGDRAYVRREMSVGEDFCLVPFDSPRLAIWVEPDARKCIHWERWLRLALSPTPERTF